MKKNDLSKPKINNFPRLTRTRDDTSDALSEKEVKSDVIMQRNLRVMSVMK